MAEFSGSIEVMKLFGLERADAVVPIYLNAAFDSGKPAGANVTRWFTIGDADPAYASAPAPVGAYSDFWIEDIISS